MIIEATIRIFSDPPSKIPRRRRNSPFVLFLFLKVAIPLLPLNERVSELTSEYKSPTRMQLQQKLYAHDLTLPVVDFELLDKRRQSQQPYLRRRF